MIAKFAKTQEPVRIVDVGNGFSDVFICVNPQEVTETYEIYNGETAVQMTETYIEYEYNEFRIANDYLDVDDLINNPDKYLKYPLPEYTELEKLRADVDYLLMLEE
jgi:hypothetical protein